MSQYFVKNRLGIYSTTQIWGYNTRIIRKSLSTRDKQQALKFSRRLVVFIDKWNDFARKFFASEADFKKAFSDYCRINCQYLKF